MLKKIFSYSAIYGMGPFVPKVASILILPLITQHLTKLDYGIYGTLMSYLMIITSLKTLGMRAVLSNAFYHHPGMYKWLWRQVYGFLYLWNIPYSIIAVLLVYVAIPEAAKKNTILICMLLVVPSLISGSSGMFGNLYYQIHQRPRQIVIRSIIIGFLNLGITYYTIAVLQLGYMGWFWSMGITQLLLNLSYWVPLNFQEKIIPIFNFKRKLLWSKLKVALPLIPHGYAYYLVDSSDRVVMDRFHFPVTQIGAYNVAYTFGSYFSMGIEAMTTTLSPMFKAMIRANDERSLRDVGLLWLVFTLCLSFIICMVSKEIFQFLFSNKDLWDSYYLSVYILMAMNYRPIYAIFVVRLFYFERTNVIWQITLIAGIINVALNLVFLKRYGIEFAALSSFITFMYMGYSGFFYKNLKDLVNENYYPIYCLMATIAITALARWGVMQPFPIRLMLAGCVFMIALIILYQYKHVLLRLNRKNY